MDSTFTQEQEEMRAHLDSFLKNICPDEYVEKCDNDGVPPYEAYKALCDGGWLGLIIPEEYGGTGGDAIDLAILLEDCYLNKMLLKHQMLLLMYIDKFLDYHLHLKHT